MDTAGDRRCKGGDESWERRAEGQGDRRLATAAYEGLAEPRPSSKTAVRNTGSLAVGLVAGERANAILLRGMLDWGLVADRPQSSSQSSHPAHQDGRRER